MFSSLIKYFFKWRIIMLYFAVSCFKVHYKPKKKKKRVIYYFGLQLHSLTLSAVVCFVWANLCYISRCLESEGSRKPGYLVNVRDLGFY